MSVQAVAIVVRAAVPAFLVGTALHGNLDPCLSGIFGLCALLLVCTICSLARCATYVQQGCLAQQKVLLMLALFVQFDDQGLVNSDSRTIAVPHDYANYIPTDIRGLTFARTPAQVQPFQLYCCW